MIPLITWRWSRHRPHRLLLTGSSDSGAAHSASVRSPGLIMTGAPSA